MDANTDTPGYLDASAYTDHLAREEDASEAEAQRLQHVYGEIARRDGAAQWHTSLWFRFACFLGVLLLASMAALVVLSVKASRVQAFVQPVQITDEGKMILVGIPQDVLAYKPEDGVWMDLLAEWTRKRRWKGDEETFKRTKNDWLWLYHHSCGLASKMLAEDERKEQPFKASARRVSIEVKSITKTTTPESYQVVFHEVSVDKLAATLKEQDYIGTFTVGRVRPKTLSEAMSNRLGLCVSGYDLAPKAGP